ncbi:hypothetical protein F0365_03940 [Nonlabens sp. Ci31]|jgi:uncharacterized protein YoxC|uniref:hypothetical protein n=1 Tax=Nonlabens sp. Ci31 TaxID=2608253 RepID=UPI001462B08E|nr:hypothetical protein [Nonlabens sp. Ci31]QJP33617.1 hypothetical protein F0365_03940 [Nonlabens sp. Ci31]
MRNSAIKFAFFSVLFMLTSFHSVAQKMETAHKVSSNTLDEITLTVKNSSFKNDSIFHENKKYLRKAVRLSEGDIDTFKNQIKRIVPSFKDISDTNWEELYDASKLLTFQGKVEELPSVL